VNESDILKLIEEYNEKIEYSDIFSVDELQQIQDQFANATGVASIITKPDGTPITKPSNFCRFCNVVIRGTEKGLIKCMKSDAEIGKQDLKGPIIQPCLSGGLWDAGASITVGGKHIANWLIGQVRNEELDEQKIDAYADEIGVDKEVYKAAFLEVPFMSTEKFTSIANLLFTISNSLSERAYRNKELELLIKAQTETENKLRLSEEKYRLLIENQNDLVVKVDNENRFIYVSPSYCKEFGKSEEELIGRSFLPLVHPDDIEPTKEAMKQLFISPYTCKVVQRAMTVNGWRWFSWNDTAIVNERGEIESIIGVGRDVTERKVAEEEIYRKNLELQISNAEKEKFFSIIAHDLRSPFNSFLGLTNLMAEELNNMTLEQIQKLAVSMKNLAGSVSRLLENLLNWSRVKRGLFPFQPKTITVVSLLGDCSETCIEMAKNKSITMNIDFPENLYVYADVDMLQMIFRNLVSNAIKYTKHGGIVWLSAKKNDNGEIVFSVKDNGIGMNKKLINSLFRIDIKTNRVGTDGEPSTGLGLLLCKEFIDRHNGRIWVESREGIGTTFFFVI
jgi:PAS domain S-box-containing protein